MTPQEESTMLTFAREMGGMRAEMGHVNKKLAKWEEDGLPICKERGEDLAGIHSKLDAIKAGNGNGHADLSIGPIKISGPAKWVSRAIIIGFIAYIILYMHGLLPWSPVEASTEAYEIPSRGLDPALMVAKK